VIWLWSGFKQAMILAGQQSALSFELRAALQLAQLWMIGGQLRRAHDLMGRFTVDLPKSCNTRIWFWRGKSRMTNARRDLLVVTRPGSARVIPLARASPHRAW